MKVWMERTVWHTIDSSINKVKKRKVKNKVK